MCWSPEKFIGISLGTEAFPNLSAGKPLLAPAAILDSAPPVRFQFQAQSSSAQFRCSGGTLPPEPPESALAASAKVPFSEKINLNLLGGYAIQSASNSREPGAEAEYLRQSSAR